MATYEVESIATVVGGGHTRVQDDYQGGVESVIRLNEAYPPLETLQGIEEFSHLTVTWLFHLARPEDVQLHARSPPAGIRTGRRPVPSSTATIGVPINWRSATRGCSRSRDGTCWSPISML